MVCVMIADDHTVMRDGVRRILERVEDFEVACEVFDGTQAVQSMHDHRPQVIALDLSVSGRSELGLLRRLYDDHLGVCVPVLTVYAEEQYVVRAFRVGVTGYPTKENAAIELATALQKMMNDGTYISLSTAGGLTYSLDEPSEKATHTRLSDREMGVYRRLMHGEPLAEIATGLYVSAKTISTHKMRLMDKLQPPSEATLARYVIRYCLPSDGDTLQLVPCWARSGLATHQ